MKIFVYEPTGSAYWFEKDTLMFIPMRTDNILDSEEGGAVEADMVGEEEIRNGGEFKILNDLYKYLEKLHEEGEL